ncbi:2-alkenal reductase [Sulfolobus sp. A20]|uniref:S1C family serine protease n=1 Tax=Saccharolobus sp. A20 TaxID=1891280 RepID=UPI00084619F7|nr:S1C family serine protease [Sulfolobus sp. A20]TRM78742.1 serine protease [Sulfolobus sp. A20-N-F8]TRM78857.1 serine protease [Sulfolobus sp. B5]TRM85498.1 serine protease [Sulfolobus sp. F3]TRM86701.1 serine protease [Sulfolobus sp. C3]TRM95517.1 serine protease [Sulfolobus sp. A20-N-G8]TRM99489.1 serine protease [Sulfolobus sp. F1]TRN01416.1 serine protease [Sulfolobus sp. E1]
MYEDLVEKVTPAVVTILTRQVTLDEFFTPQVAEGIGSGFSIEKNLLITSYHVIESARDIIAISEDGFRDDVEVVAVNPFHDLAILRTSLSLPSLKLSTKYRTGEVVLAVGNPLGLYSVSMGIISSEERTIMSPIGSPVYVIQTDAAVNPGNSGGPLVNEKGEVVGVVTAMIRNAQNIGFAIPSKLVISFVNNVMRFGRYVRPYIGISVTKLNKALATYLGIKKTNGLLVVNVDPAGSAYKYGIEKGDVILKIDDMDITSPSDLIAILENKVGSYIKVRVLKDSREAEIKIPVLAVNA